MINLPKTQSGLLTIFHIADDCLLSDSSNTTYTGYVISKYVNQILLASGTLSYAPFYDI